VKTGEIIALDSEDENLPMSYERLKKLLIEQTEKNVQKRNGVNYRRHFNSSDSRYHSNGDENSWRKNRIKNKPKQSLMFDTVPVQNAVEK
jgi:hypothetical protein